MMSRWLHLTVVVSVGMMMLHMVSLEVNGAMTIVSAQGELTTQSTTLICNQDLTVCGGRVDTYRVPLAFSSPIGLPLDGSERRQDGSSAAVEYHISDSRIDLRAEATSTLAIEATDNVGRSNFDVAFRLSEPTVVRVAGVASLGIQNALTTLIGPNLRFEPRAGSEFSEELTLGAGDYTMAVGVPFGSLNSPSTARMELQVVPEPSALVLSISMLVGVVASQRRRRQRR